MALENEEGLIWKRLMNPLSERPITLRTGGGYGPWIQCLYHLRSDMPWESYQPFIGDLLETLLSGQNCRGYTIHREKTLSQLLAVLRNLMSVLFHEVVFAGQEFLDWSLSLFTFIIRNSAFSKFQKVFHKISLLNFHFLSFGIHLPSQPDK